eukprot:352421-Chlamydomonas_euryale.AAC.17
MSHSEAELTTTAAITYAVIACPPATIYTGLEAARVGGLEGACGGGPLLRATILSNSPGGT